MNDVQLQWDPRGVPYQVFPGQAPRYISPLEALALSRAQGADPRLAAYAQSGGNAGPASLGPDPMNGGAETAHSGLDQHGLWRGGDSFNTETGNIDQGGLNWGAIIPLLAGSAIGGYGAFSALSGAGGAAGGAGAASGSAASAGGFVPGMATLPAGAASGAVPAAFAGAGAGAGAAGLAALSPAVKAALGIGLPLAGHLVSNAAGNSAIPPQLQQLLQMGMDRAQSQTPLFNATTQGAFDMLPEFAKTNRAQPRPGSGG